MIKYFKKASIEVQISLIIIVVAFGGWLVMTQAQDSSELSEEDGGATNTSPTIILVGSSSMTVQAGQSFTDPGATASDVEDGSLTSQIQTSGSVDTGTPGEYQIEYSVTDSGGLSDSKTRVIVVEAAPSQVMTSGGGGGRRDDDEDGLHHSSVLSQDDGGVATVVSTTTATTSDSLSAISTTTPDDPNSPSVNPSTPKFLFKNNLSKGMKGSDVFELQKRLQSEGLYDYPELTGYFGAITFNSILRYQIIHRDEIGYVTGFLGPRTRAILNK